MVTNDPVHQQWLESFIAEAGGIAGTVHVQVGEDLVLTAAHNIPPQVVQAVSHVARGKGMAGLAQVRREPVRTCDLQTDDSGRIRPGARAVEAQAAIALPVLDAAGGTVAVVGVAWAGAGDIDAATERRLAGRARELARAIA
jgi:L-methionine (R)-S-oxide reductase